MSSGADDKFSADKTFALKYNVEVGQFTAENLEESKGVADALVLTSMVYPEDGSLSTMLMTIDGREGKMGKALPDTEVFKVWSHMANSLAKSESLPPDLRIICKNTFEVIREFILTK